MVRNQVQMNSVKYLDTCQSCSTTWTKEGMSLENSLGTMMRKKNAPIRAANMGATQYSHSDADELLQDTSHDRRQKRSKWANKHVANVLQPCHTATVVKQTQPQTGVKRTGTSESAMHGSVCARATVVDAD